MKWSHNFALYTTISRAGFKNRFGDISVIYRGIGYQFIYQMSLKIKNEILLMQQYIRVACIVQ